MLDLKQAYAILGLEETASIEDVERKYSLLLKKSRPKTDNRIDGDGISHEGYTMKEVTEAYYFITHYDELQAKINDKLANPFTDRLSHIWEYYRFHIIGGLCALLIVVYMAREVVQNRHEEAADANADVRISFFGDFPVNELDTSLLKNRLLNDFPDWKSVTATLQYSPIEAKDQYEVALQQKAFISMGYDKLDLYILDPVNFERFGKQGAFLALDGGEKRFTGVPNEIRRTLKQEKDETDRLYGIDVSGSPVLKELQLPEGAKIAAVRSEAKHKDQALRTLEWLLKH